MKTGRIGRLKEAWEIIGIEHIWPAGTLADEFSRSERTWWRLRTDGQDLSALARADLALIAPVVEVEMLEIVNPIETAATSVVDAGYAVSPEMATVVIGDELVSVPKLMKAMQHAQFIASLYSKDPRTKVGALILRDDWSPVSWGYNGFPRGTRETPEIWENREAKYKRVLHAESNAIDTARQDLRGTTIFCTLFPCSNCAGRIIQNGIKRVVYRGDTRDDLGAREAFEMFEDAEVKVIKLEGC